MLCCAASSAHGRQYRGQAQWLQGGDDRYGKYGIPTLGTTRLD
ncbi:hypothetical protein [Trichothermofontia sp.]